MFSKTPTTTDLQAQCLGNRVNNWSQIIKPLSTAQAAQLCPHQTTGKGKSLQRATCSSSHEPSPDSTISSQWVWEAAQAGSKCLTSPSLTLRLSKIKPLQSETKPDFMTITSNLPKCAPGCGQATVADRAAVCQLSCDSCLGHELVVYLWKNHHNGSNHLHEQMNQVYRTSAHSSADEALVKPQQFAQPRPYTLSL